MKSGVQEMNNCDHCGIGCYPELDTCRAFICPPDATSKEHMDDLAKRYGILVHLCTAEGYFCQQESDVETIRNELSV